MIEHVLTVEDDGEGITVGDLAKFTAAAMLAGSGEHAPIEVDAKGKPKISVTVQTTE